MNEIEATAKVIPITSAKKTPEPRRATQKRRKRRRTVQWLVDCTSGPEPDLTGLPGALTVDHIDGEPWEATFDPDDETIDNAVVPVASFASDGEKARLTSEDDQVWAFALVSEPYEPEEN